MAPERRAAAPAAAPESGRRILMRSHRDLLAPTTGPQVLRRNQIGENSGNLIFAYSVQRALSVPGADIVADTGRIDPANAERINDEFDMYVVPLANAFRLTFAPQLERYAELFERLTIPVVIPGVGAQFNATASDLDRLDRLVPSVHRFVRAVLARSASIGVRGEVTYGFLRKLGYSDSEVSVIGCPSLFAAGPTLSVDRGADLTPQSRVAMNVTPYVKAMAPVVAHHEQRYPNLRYIAQDITTLNTLLYWQDPEALSKKIIDGIPYRTTDPLLAENRTRFFIDPLPWINYLSGFDFAFGSRIHGNITALLAGTPAVLLGHDSRTVELADYHEIPYRLMADVGPDVDVADLQAGADYSGFNGNQRERFDRYLAFLDANGVEHVFSGKPQATTGVAAFDRKISRVPSVGPIGRPTPATAAARRLSRTVRAWPRRLGLR